MVKVDWVIFGFILVLAGVYFYATEKLPSLEIGDPLGPKAFPRLLGVGLLITAIILLFEILRARKTAPPVPTAAAPPFGIGLLRDRMPQVEDVPRAAAETGPNSYHIVAGVTVWTFLYFLVFEPLGFIIATPIYLLALMAFFHPGKWISNVLTSVLFSVGSYVMFVKVLGVNLARGILPF